MIFSIKKRNDVSHAEFYRYWLGTHAPLVAHHQEILRIKRYTQSHGVHSEVGEKLARHRGATSRYDGVAELWWENLSDLKLALDSQEANAALLMDESKFIDFEQSDIQLTQEYQVIT